MDNAQFDKHGNFKAVITLRNQTGASIRAGSEITYTGQSLIDIPSLAIAIEPDLHFWFQVILSVKSSTSAGNRYAISFSQPDATVDAIFLATSTSVNDQVSGRITAFDTPTIPVLTVADVDGFVTISGVISTGDYAGVMSIQHLKETSGTATVHSSSFIQSRKLG